MKIAIFKVKCSVLPDGTHTLNQEKREMIDPGDNAQFDEGQIALKAQEVAEWNNKEITIAKSFGAGDTYIDFKLIV